MEHSPEQQQYFQFAYQTGSDIWTHIPYRYKAQHMLPELSPDALVLDIGAGRGLWAMRLLEHGYRVLGIDYIESIVEKVNQQIKESGYEQRARFMVGDALDIPFVDHGFDAITDIGTFQHMKQEQWDDYVYEAHRTLKPGGYYLNVSLSKRTNTFLGFRPHASQSHHFTKFGVHYYFFDDEEIPEIFAHHFTVIDQQFESYESQSDPGDDVVLVFTLMQKKSPQTS